MKNVDKVGGTSSVEEPAASIREVAVQVKENSDNVTFAMNYVGQAGDGLHKVTNKWMKCF